MAPSPTVLIPPMPPPPLTSSSAAPSTNHSTSSLQFDILSESADKIFGIENFGNTCYCNSVLQCLYYSKPFREHVIAFSNESNGHRNRRTAVHGSKPHPFTQDNNSLNIPTSSTLSSTANGSGSGANSTSLSSFTSSATPVATALANVQAQQKTRQRTNANDQHHVNSNTESSTETKKSQLSLGRRLSLFGGSKSSSEKSSSKHNNHTNANNGSSNNNPDSNTNSKNIHGGSNTGHINNSGSIINLNSHTNHTNSHSTVADSDTQDEDKTDTSENMISNPSVFNLSSHGNMNNNNNNNNSNNNNNNNASVILPNNLAFDTNGPTNYANSKLLYPALRTLTLGVRYPGQNIPVVGYNDDPFATPEVRKRAALLKGPIVNIDLSYSNSYNMKESLFTCLKDIFECMGESSSQIGVVAPTKLIEVLKRENELFRSSMHQDAHEFLNFLLNEVIENIDRQNRIIGSATSSKDVLPNGISLSATPSTRSRWVHDLFEGLLTSETKCLTCETVSRRDEQFLDLSIDIERNTSVTACLRQFSASEMLCERNKFNCDNCGGFHEAQKRMKVKKLPKILALHLKRFKYTEDLQRNVKLFHRVVYPRYLRLFNTTHDAQDPEKLYELYAVVVHIGGGPYHGHYVSVVKTENAGWLLFDDEMVEAVDPNYVFNFFGDNKSLATAYVLFYQEVFQEQYEYDNLFPNFNALRNIPQHSVNLNYNNNNGGSGLNHNNNDNTSSIPVVSPTPVVASTTTLSTEVEELEKSAESNNNLPEETSTHPIPILQPKSSASGSSEALSSSISRSVSPMSPKNSTLFVPKRPVQGNLSDSTANFSEALQPPSSAPTKEAGNDNATHSQQSTPTKKESSHSYGLSRFKSGTLSRRSMSHTNSKESGGSFWKKSSSSIPVTSHTTTGSSPSNEFKDPYISTNSGNQQSENGLGTSNGLSTHSSDGNKYGLNGSVNHSGVHNPASASHGNGTDSLTVSSEKNASLSPLAASSSSVNTTPVAPTNNNTNNTSSNSSRRKSRHLSFAFKKHS